MTSVDPLRVYLCRDGLARLCTEDYAAPAPANLANQFVHLTNYSINRRSAAYAHDARADDGGRGSKHV